MLGRALNSKFMEKTRRFFYKNTGIFIKIKRFTPSASDELRTAKILINNNIDTVIDIGGNIGQFAESLIDFGYKGDIISFEPVSSCHQTLLKRSQKHKNWIVAERCAIGEKDGSTSINLTQSSVFSSILKTKDWHSESKPTSQIVATEDVPLFKLDSIIHKYVKDLKGKRILLKIDTQGYEKQVLEGAGELLKHIVGIKIEIPLVPIYENVGLTFYSTLNFLEKENFTPYSFNNEGVNLETGRLNTIDGIFLRSEE